MRNNDDLFETRGKVGEYLVNNTLYNILDSGRFRKSFFKKKYYMFDGLVLPSSGNSSVLTEIDHLLIGVKGIFVIETKSISGHVFGERNSQKWYSAAPSLDSKSDIYDRVFTNPFYQNRKHVMSVVSMLKENGFNPWVNNIVVLVDANLDGWLPGEWKGPEIKDLFLSPIDLALNIQKRETVMTPKEVFEIGKVFQPLYANKDQMRKEFFNQISNNK